MDLRHRAIFCDVCKAMLSSIADSSNWAADGSQPTMTGPHHMTAKSLFMSAAWGCGICTSLKELLGFNHMFPIKYSPATNGDPWLRYVFEIDSSCIEVFQLSFKDWPDTTCLGILLGKQMEEEEQATDQYDLKHLLSDNTGDEEVLERARLWLSDCISHHPSCGEFSQPHYLPPRLLYLDGDSVQLIETKEAKISGRYTALSYCWGRSPRHLTLTTDNYDTLRKGLKVSELSKTFRDAFQVIQSLGVHLLWIDALCILQVGEGSVEDWQKHLVEMAVIYSNCFFSIAVDHGESTDAGCFMPRDPDSIRPCVFEPASSTRNSTNSSSKKDENSLSGAFLLHDSTIFYRLFNQTPLNSRGWVQQERLLSPRILHFGKTQLLWECTALCACETSPMGLDNLLVIMEVPFSFRGNTSEQWYRVIEAYSTTSLTKPYDKLPAIAGIAKRVSTERNAEYVAGLFMSDMPEALLWSYDGSLGSVVSPYRAPSWSWASREGEVSFSQTTQGARENAMAFIEDVALEYIDKSNPFGQIEGGFIRITAPIVDLVWAKAKTHTGGWAGDVKLVALDSSDSLDDMSSFTGHIFFDEQPISRSTSGMRLIFISSNDAFLGGLILTPDGKSAQPLHWIRAGIFSLRSSANITSRLRVYPKSTIELI